MDGVEAHGYVRMPPVEETIAAHLCPSLATIDVDLSLLPKPCRLTAHLPDKAYTSTGEVAFALNMMAVLQVFQSFKERDFPQRVGASPRVSTDDLGQLREGRGGFIYDEREHTLPTVLFAVSFSASRERSDIALAKSQTLRIPSCEDFAWCYAKSGSREHW